MVYLGTYIPFPHSVRAKPWAPLRRLVVGVTRMNSAFCRAVEVAADEGVEAVTEYAGPAGPRIEEFAAGIRSGLSYAGAGDLATARQNAEFIRVTPTTKRRNGAHGFARTE